MLRTVHVTRYVLPPRERGSLPAIVEAEASAALQGHAGDGARPEAGPS